MLNITLNLVIIVKNMHQAVLYQLSQASLYPSVFTIYWKEINHNSFIENKPKSFQFILNNPLKENKNETYHILENYVSNHFDVLHKF